MTKKTVQGYKTRLDKMKSDRTNTDNYWQEVAEYCLPRRDFTTERSTGQNRKVSLYEDIGTVSVESLASALHSMMTPMSTQWAVARAIGGSKDLNRFLSNASRIAHDLFRAPHRGLYRSMHEVYLDVVAFGNGAVFISRQGNDVIFQSRDLKSCWIKENEYGNVNTVYYKFKMPIWEIVERWGEGKVSEKMLKAKDQNESVELLHVVEPRANSLGKGAVKSKKPFSSVYIDLKNDHIIEEGGYDSFPYAFGRFQKRSGEIYGYGPAMEALSSIKMLNQIKEIMIRGGTKAVDPVLLVASEGLFSPPKFDAGSVIYFDPTQPAPTSLNTNYRPDYFEYIIEKSYEFIERMFYTNWLNTQRQPNMTATEVIQRTQESLRMLSPMLSRLQAELLTPLFKRSFEIMLTLGFFGEPPEDFDIDSVVIDYISPMDQAQRISNANNLLQGIGFASQSMAFDPSIRHDIDWSRMTRQSLLDSYNWPVEFIVDEKKADEAKKTEARQQELQAGSEIAKNMGATVGDLIGGQP